MRISLEGLYTMEEFARAVERVVAELEANGTELIKGVNLYIVPLAENRVLHFIGEDGEPTDHLVFDGPIIKTMRNTALRAYRKTRKPTKFRNKSRSSAAD